MSTSEFRTLAGLHYRVRQPVPTEPESIVTRCTRGRGRVRPVHHEILLYQAGHELSAAMQEDFLQWLAGIHTPAPGVEP